MFILFMSYIDNDEDAERFEEIYRLYHGFAYSVCYSILRDYQLAEDGVQECFIQVALNIKKVAEAESNRTKNFIYIVAKCKAIDIYRKQKRTQALVEMEQLYGRCREEQGIEDIVVEQEEIREIMGAISSLPASSRDILELLLYYHFTRAEIADLMGISYNTVKLRIHRARKKLGEELRKRGVI